MTARKKRLIADLLRLARHNFLTDRPTAIVLQLLATAVELGTTDSLAQLAISHGTARLEDFRAEVDAALAEIGSGRLTPSRN